MKFSCPYWTSKEKIELLERWILVHCTLYYKLSSSIVSDLVYDNNAKQLVAYSKKYEQAFYDSRYYYVFKDFDVSTGFDLYMRLENKDADKVLLDAKMLKERYNEKENK